MSNLLIQPLKINQPSTKTVPNINMMADFGVEKELGNKINTLLEKKQKYEEIQAETFGQHFAASMTKLILDRDNKGKIDKRLFYSTDSYDTLNKEIKTNIESFIKDSKELSLDQSVIEKYSSMVTRELEKSNVNYLAEYNDHNLKIAKDEASKTIKIKGDNLASLAMLGDYKSSINGFFNLAKDLDIMVENEYITGEKAVELAAKQRQNIIVGYVSSFVNNPNGKQILSQMQNYSAMDFMNKFADLNFENELGQFLLTPDDYNKFQSVVKSGLTRIDKKEKKEKIELMVDKLKYEQKKKTNSLEIALKEDQVPAEGYIPETTLIKAIEYRNGIKAESVDEAIRNGLTIPWKEKGLNDTTELYKNPSLSGEGIMNFRQDEANDLASVYGIEGIKNFYDTTDTSVVGGSLVMETYQMNTGFKDKFDKFYNTENRKILSNFDKVEVTNFDQLKEFETEFKTVTDSSYVTPTSFMSGQIGNATEKVTTIAAGSKIAGLQNAANNGSIAAARATKDISRMATDSLILKLYSEHGGIITDDLADKAEFKEKYIGRPIESLTTSEKQTFLKNILKNDKKIRKSINEEVENVINSVTEGLDTINLGNGRVVFAPKIIKEEEITDFRTGKNLKVFVIKNRDIEKTEKTITELISTNTYKVNINGTSKEIGDKKNINFVQDIGSTQVRLFYGGQPVFTDKGYAVFDIEEFIKEE